VCPNNAFLSYKLRWLFTDHKGQHCCLIHQAQNQSTLFHDEVTVSLIPLPSDENITTPVEVVPVETVPAVPVEAGWQQGQVIDVTITDLSDSGDGVGRSHNRVVFVPDTVTGDRAQVRLVRVKPQYAYGKLLAILEPSPHRIRARCIVADKCGGCQWQHVDYAYQLEAKSGGSGIRASGWL
jgi:23S rRNA (uracil1939-C5)-methyltransferase